MSTIISFRLFIKVLIKLDLLPYLIPFSNLELLALDCGTLLLVACLLFAALVVWWCLTMFWMCVVSIVCVAVGVSRLAPSIGLVCAEFIFSWALGLYTYGLYSLDFYLCLFVQFRSCNAFKKITDKKISKLYWEKKKTQTTSDAYRITLDPPSPYIQFARRWRGIHSPEGWKGMLKSYLREGWVELSCEGNSFLGLENLLKLNY